jgi:hypothetical protein
MTNRILVVCYSRGGTTLQVARRIAEALDGDLEAVEESGSRTGLGGYVCSAIEALAKGLPTIRTRRDPSDYDLVVVGTPVWVGTMSSPIRSYLFGHRRQLRRVAFFAVMGGRGGEDAIKEMQLACGAPDAPSLVLTQRDIEHRNYGAPFDAFVRAVKAAAAKEPHLGESRLEAVTH